MDLLLHPTKCLVVSASNDELQFLRDYLIFEDESRAFVRGKRGKAKRVQPPKILLFDAIEDSFPAGLLPLVKMRAQEEGFRVRVSSALPPPTLRDPTAPMAWLRPYQLRAVEAAIAQERGIMWLPTGSGKTEVAFGLIRALPTRWLFVVHRADIADQTAERFDLRQKEHAGTGWVGDSHRAARFYGGSHEIGDRLTVATFQTLRSQQSDPATEQLFRQVGGLIVDECHTLPASTFYQIAQKFVGARYRLGLSGTPLDRGDKRSLMAVGALGPVIHRIRTAELIDRGLLARPEIRFVKVEQDFTKPTWQGVYGEGVVRSTRRNKALAQIASRAESPGIIFIKEKRHAKELRAALGRAGIPNAIVWGDSPLAARNSAKERLARGDIDFVIASVVWQEGVDIPELRSIVVACGGKSVIAALQRVGRGTRPGEDKTSFEVWDVMDIGNSMLEKHSRARRKAYIREGFQVDTYSLTALGLL